MIGGRAVGNLGLSGPPRTEEELWDAGDGGLTEGGTGRGEPDARRT